MVMTTTIERWEANKEKIDSAVEHLIIVARSGDFYVGVPNSGRRVEKEIRHTIDRVVLATGMPREHAGNILAGYFVHHKRYDASNIYFQVVEAGLRVKKFTGVKKGLQRR
jgi:hypothetical protein